MIVAKSPDPADIRRWARSVSLTPAPSATSASSDGAAASPASISHVRRTAGSRRSTSPIACRRAGVSTTIACAPESVSIHSTCSSEEVSYTGTVTAPAAQSA
jgi:hypothetical protein